MTLPGQSDMLPQAKHEYRDRDGWCKGCGLPESHRVHHGEPRAQSDTRTGAYRPMIREIGRTGWAFLTLTDPSGARIHEAIVPLEEVPQEIAIAVTRAQLLAAAENPAQAARLQVHPDVAEKFVAAAIADGAQVPNPPELDGAFRLALQWAYMKLGGDVARF